MIPEKMIDVLKHEGIAAISTLGDGGQHMVNTWNSYIQFTEDDRLLIPAGGMNKTETNVSKNNRVLMTIGSREVAGFRGPGAGFLIKGAAAFKKSGPEFDDIKKRFPWARAAVEIRISSVTQTL